jgi:hypothetical protein
MLMTGTVREFSQIREGTSHAILAVLATWSAATRDDGARLEAGAAKLLRSGF